MCRYARVSGGEGAAAVHHDRPAHQPEGAAPLGPRRAEEDGGVAAGEAAAADGAGSTAAGAGTGHTWGLHTVTVSPPLGCFLSEMI